MKRHILGVTIFVAIVASAVTIYTVFRSFEVPSVPGAVTVSNERPYACDRKPKRSVDTQIVSAEYDAWSGEMVATVRVFWNGRGSAPERVYFRVFLTDKRDGSVVQASSTDVVSMPSNSHGVVERTVRFARPVMEKFEDLDNIYAYVEAAEDGKFTSSRSERIDSARYLPVLKIHK